MRRQRSAEREMMQRFHTKQFLGAVILSVLAIPATAQKVITQEELEALESSPSRLSDVPIPLLYAGVPGRPQPLFEAGNPYHGTGSFEDNLFLPTGAVFQPSLLVWGTYSSAVNVASDEEGTREVTEWANRLDLFAEYRLSGTERLVLGFRPLDETGEFTGYDFEESESTNGFNGEVRTLFFEGDFGEIFPGLDPDDSRALDYGFSIGRQPLFFQNGIILNDTLDTFGVTRNSLRFWGLSNARFTALVGWNDINRGFGLEDEDATLVGFLTEVDTQKSTIEIDAVATMSGDGGDGAYLGYGSTQRIGDLNTTFRVNTSNTSDDTQFFVDDGLLLSAEFSLTPHATDDLVYLNTFVGIDSYRSAAQSPASPGPLAGTGILFAGSGVGTAGVPLGGFSDDSAAAAFGFQKFYKGGREQFIAELGGRFNYDLEKGAVALGTRWQRAWGQHTIFAIDLYGGLDDTDGATGGFDGAFVGTRVGIVVKF